MIDKIPIFHIALMSTIKKQYNMFLKIEKSYLLKVGGTFQLYVNKHVISL